MSPIIFWMLGISFSAAGTIFAVVAELRGLQFIISLVMVGFVALAALRDQRALQSMGAYPSHGTATIVRHMGLMYGWAAVIIALIYTLLLDWHHWFVAFFIMSSGATLCLFLANILMRDLSDMAVDTHLVRLIGSIAKAQFAATCVCFGGLLALGQWSPSTLGGGDGAIAVNVLLSTALGLAALSAYTMLFPTGIEPEADDEPKATNTTPAASVAKPSRETPSGRRPAKTFGKATVRRLQQTAASV